MPESEAPGVGTPLTTLRQAASPNQLNTTCVPFASGCTATIFSGTRSGPGGGSSPGGSRV
jgi:hypothetical protein